MQNFQFKKNDIGISIFRFANIIHFGSVSVDNIQSVVKTVKSEASLDLSCNNEMLSGDSMLSQVKAVEQMLQIESSEYINDTLTNEELKTAAEMFLYLNTCPSLFKSWILFYEDLFLTQSADKMILTLNRMMKTETLHDKDGKLRAKKLLQRTAQLLSLQFEGIGNFLGEKYFHQDISGTDFKVPNGAVFHFLSFYLLLIFLP